MIALPAGTRVWLAAGVTDMRGWRSSVMVERYAHLAPEHLAKAANRLDSLIGGYDFATLQKEKGSAEDAKPL